MHRGETKEVLPVLGTTLYGYVRYWVYLTCLHTKAWVKRQTLVQSYGAAEEEGEDVDNPDDLLKEVQQSMADSTVRLPIVPSVIPALSHDVDVLIGGKGCAKCGSLSHKQSNHKDCPYNKRKQ